jgi:hypothetical protein
LAAIDLDPLAGVHPGCILRMLVGFTAGALHYVPWRGRYVPEAGPEIV